VQNETFRDIDLAARDVYGWWHKSYVFIKRTQIRAELAVFIIVFFIGAIAAAEWMWYFKVYTFSSADEGKKSVMIETMKRRGCVADGIFSGYGGDMEKAIDLINRSQCLYLHRSIETWLAPPDFEKAQAGMKKITNPNMIFGMFIAEAINTKGEYSFGGENFNPSKMCRGEGDDFWGKGTCRPTFGSEEYRNYLKYITRRAIDLGVQSFLFGQVYFQEGGSKSYAKEIVSEMRKYAKSKEKVIVIGAQTNNISDEKYLKIFDFIEGGVGINDKGEIENGPCFSKWWKKPGDRCWALLWHDDFSKKADNVFLHLDWSGFYDDDMSIFSRMDKTTREKTLKNLYTFFVSKKMGFMMPFLAVINKDSVGCYGPTREFYSPNNLYSCQDEDFINNVFRSGGSANAIISSGTTFPIAGSGSTVPLASGSTFPEENMSVGNTSVAPEVKPVKDGAQFIKQNIPLQMKIGETYPASITLKNTGDSDWTNAGGYWLGFAGKSENNIGIEKVEIFKDKTVKPGEEITFGFEILAPQKAGKYSPEFQMTKGGKEWFGDLTKKIEISVE